MSMENAKAFLGLLSSDKSLRGKVAGGGEDAALKSMVALGAEKKLSFTAAELKDAAQEIKKSGKLSEKELDAVAGGGCKVILLSVACSDI
jgi:predicted ribosomally synthesized peptide with nif11-like leader